MDVSYTDYSNDGEVSRCLNTLDLYLSEDASVTPETAQKALKTLEHFLGDENKFRQLNYSTLGHIDATLKDYQEKYPAEAKASKTFGNIFGKGHKGQNNLEFQSKVEHEMHFDRAEKNGVVRNELKRIATLPENEMRQELRVLIIDLCRGRHGHPISMSTAIDLLKEAMTHPKLESLINSPDLFSLYECKTGKLNQPPRDLGECISTKLEQADPTLVPKPNTRETIQELKQQRLFALNNLQTVYQKTLEDPTQRINSKFFPQTRAWFVGSTRKGNVPFELEAQRIGKEHGIPVITDSLEPIDQEKGKVLKLEQDHNGTYPQDYVDFSRNEVRVPLMIDPSQADEIRDKLTDGRVQRDPDWSKKENPDGSVSPQPPINQFPMIGEPLGKGLQDKAIELASALDATPVMNLTYSEGGNSLIGTRNDGSMYAIIGADSYDISRILIEEDLGKPPTEEEMLMAFAIDYGIPVEDIYFIEQPGDFHLDMNMAIVGDGVIAVNDAEMAQAVFEPENDKKGLSDDYVNERCHPFIQQKKLFEDKAAADLEHQGFEVIRVPGRFENTHFSMEPRMNFFNMLTATTPKGEKIIVAMGVPSKKYVELFIDMTKRTGIHVPSIYFLNDEDSAESLQYHGGISCRAKTI